MTSQKAVVFLLLLIGFISAFNISAYLLPTEQNVSISYTNFTYNDTPYSLVAINGADTFLLKSGEPVSDGDGINAALYSYYQNTYYPSADDLANLTGLIKQFNDSRNDGYDFKGKEEYLCRDDILLSNGKITVSGKPVVCKDNESCATNAELLFQVYGEGLNLGSPDALLAPLMAFTPASLRLDELLGNYTQRLAQSNQSNMVDTINYIRDSSVELRPLATRIQTTIFRTPRLNDSNDRKDCQLRCYAICPSFQLDMGAADSIHSLAQSLSTKLAPIGNYQSDAANILNRTTQRLQRVKNEDTSLYYSDLFKPISQSGNATIAQTQDALSHVQNKTVSAKLDQLKSLHVTIPDDIQNDNFTTLDVDISTYKNLSDELNNASSYLLGEYNKTRNAKNIQNSLILVLESKDLDPVSAKDLELLRNQTDDLNAQFRDGITVAQLNTLADNYTSLSQSAQLLLKTESDTPATRVLLLFRGFARYVNTGIAQVAEKTPVVPKQNIPQSPLPLGIFSLVFFLSFGSILLLLFIHIFTVHRFQVPKTGHILGAAFLSLIMILMVFSVLLYLFLGKTSNNATLPEFLSEFNAKNSTSIVVDLRNASLSDATSMSGCASSLAQSFNQKNKTWTIYTLTPSACSSTNSAGGNSSYNSTDCQKKIDGSESSFLLNYSSKNEPPKFSIIYRNQAEIKANNDYYQSCPLVALFS